MRHLRLFLLLLCACWLAPAAWAQNSTQTVSQVASAVTLNDAVDYVITGATPFATAGSVDICNDDAVVIFKYLKPSVVKKSWLKYLLVNGEHATTKNVWVGIYENGAIVYPHTREGFQPLTVYSETDFGGESCSDYTPYEFYNSAKLMGAMDNNIRSFRLKRGYMATLACNYNGTGFSRVFIAQDADLEVSELQKELLGKVSFIRVFPWNKVTKKGSAGGGEDQMDALNITWFYNWSAGELDFADYEYVPQHHHEGWPSWDGINAQKYTNTVLGNNEPDNQGDQREEYIAPENIEAVFFAGSTGNNGSWISNAYKGGLRVGTPAMSGNTYWLTTFISLAEQYNCRLDFVAAHGYWFSPGSSYYSGMTWYSNLGGGRPVWLTEFNYGANWTSWISDDHSASEANQIAERDALADICNNLEAHPKVERYAIYNWVEDCRAVYLNGALTKAGEWYANLKSNTSYNADNAFTMKWNHKAPINLAATYYDSSNRAILTWSNPNGKQTDSTWVERKINNEDTWTVIQRRGLQGVESQVLNADTLIGVSGTVTYRIHNFDCDHQQRYSGEVTITIGGTSAANAFCQLASISTAAPEEEVKVDYEEAYDEQPAVFAGPMTYHNIKTTTSPYFRTTTIKKDCVTYNDRRWSHQPSADSVYTKPETLPLLIIPYGNYTFGDMAVEVGRANVKTETEVTFAQPFPEGVTPVVIATVNNASNSSRAIMHKVWDVTNTGFKCNVSYEDALDAKVPVAQKVAYLAVSPGNACVDSVKGIYLAAGQGTEPVYGIARKETFLWDQGGETPDTLLLKEPYIFAGFQTANATVPTTLRRSSVVTQTAEDEDGNAVSYTTGVRLKRIVDKSVTTSKTDVKATADNVGWVCFHQGEKLQADAIGAITAHSENTLQVRVVNRIVYVDNAPAFELFTLGGAKAAPNATQQPGIYIVRANGQTAKILIP